MRAARGIEAVGVVIPARDEEQLLPRCLDALDLAATTLAAVRPEVVVRAVVVADLSTDSTYEIADAHPLVDSLAVEHGDVGAARRAGAAHVFAALDGGQHAAGVWLATTDADSVVPADWLVRHVQLADQGADVVVGTVTPEFTGLSPEQRHAWESTHSTTVPNGHVHGANLGVRGSAYLAVDGFRPRKVGEDVDLVARMAAEGFTIIPSIDVDVVTSARADSRAPGGYARWLHDGGLLERSPG